MQCKLVANDKSKYERVFEDNGLPKDFTDKFRIEDEGGV
jgi:hypothetical protein